MAKGTVNKVILVGRLGQDPDIRYSANGNAVAKFSLATVDRVSSDGEWKDLTEWHKVVAFGKTAEFVGNYLGKGKLAYIEGCLRTNKWEKDGVTHYTTEVLAREVQGVGGNGESNGGSQGQSKPQNQSKSNSSGGSKQQSRPKSQEDEFGGFPPDDDIPF